MTAQEVIDNLEEKQKQKYLRLKKRGELQSYAQEEAQRINKEISEAIDRDQETPIPILREIIISQHFD